MRQKQKIFMLEGVDRCGKTEIAKELSRRYKIPYFRMPTQHKNWKVPGAFVNALRYDQTYSAEFLKQTKYSVVLDRGYPSEWVYSRVFQRKTDDKVLQEVDEEFAALGTVIIVPMKRDYSLTHDDIVPNDKMNELHTTYYEFCDWTKCKTIRLYVDDFYCSLEEEIPQIKAGLKDVNEFGFSHSIRSRWSFSRWMR